jgi:hypothetical protein
MVLAMDDETFEATEPAYDAPPRLSDADERRLHARAFNHWATLQRGRSLPRPADLDLQTLGGFAPNSVLLAIALGSGAPSLRFVGPRLRAQDRLGPQARLVDVPPGSLVARLVARVPEVLAARAPVGFADEFAASPGSELLCRGVLMPLASDGETIDLIHGVVSWKEVLSPDLAKRLAAELGGAVELRRAAKPLVDPFG